MHKKVYISVILPLALPQEYTYAVPDALVGQIREGVRVEVPLKNKLYSGIIFQIKDTLPEGVKTTKEIVSILDEKPLVTKYQLELWSWMAKYYCCSMGEVMGVAMPAALKLESETKLVFNKKNDIDLINLDDDAYLLAEALDVRNELTIGQVQDILNKKSVYPTIRTLLDLGIVHIKEELIRKVKPRTVKMVYIHPQYNQSLIQFTEALELVKKIDRQHKVLLAYYQLEKDLTKSVFLSDLVKASEADYSVIKALVKKEILIVENSLAVDRMDQLESMNASFVLSEHQSQALKDITSSFEEGKPCLLHGITGSGKTNLYAHLIMYYAHQGKQVLYMLPEISLTTHLTERLKNMLNADIVVYHSRISQNKRLDAWNKVLEGAHIVIGARSSIFLPFKNLGLIIVDEEHDPSYKQQDPAPRYNGRDMAAYLTHMMKSHLLLGSATPSLETYYNASLNKYGFARLNERYGEHQLPSIELINLKDCYQDKRFDGILSQALLDEIKSVYDAGRQSIIFQNRRGYAPSLLCATCDWQSTCPNCDVPLTVHKFSQDLKCHYCGTRSKVPQTCPSCGSDSLVEIGMGTQKVEEALLRHFPEMRIARMDYDTTRSKANMEEIIQDFSAGQFDILVGTQMISKGLDFEKIDLVGVINADTLLRYPDFRANERAFQLLTQVAGRAGRRDSASKVLIQTFSVTHPVLLETKHHLYNDFYQREMAERHKFVFPPFFRIIQIELLHTQAHIVDAGAKELYKILQPLISFRIAPPIVPSIERIKNKYIRQIVIKFEKEAAVMHVIKTHVIDSVSKLKRTQGFKSLRINIDVDPY